MKDSHIVTLSVFGPTASVACFKYAEDLLTFSVEEQVPDPSQFSKIKKAKEF